MLASSRSRNDELLWTPDHTFDFTFTLVHTTLLWTISHYAEQLTIPIVELLLETPQL